MKQASRTRISGPAGTGSRRRLVLLVVLLLGVAAAGFAFRATDLRIWWLDRKTEKELESLAARSDSDAVTRYVYAKRLLRSNRGHEALDAFIRAEAALPAKATGPLAAEINSRAGYLLVRERRDEEALPYLFKAAELDYNDSVTHVGLGMVYDARQMPTYASTEYRIATQLDPENVEAWYRLGGAALADHKAAQAVEPFQRAIQLAPNDAASRAGLGSAYAIQSQFDKALPEFRKAAEIDPGNVDFKSMVANAEASAARTPDQYREATEAIQSVLKLRPEDTKLHFTLAGLYQRSGDLQKARDELRYCVKAAPTLAEAWYNLSIVERRLGDDKSADAANKRFQHLTDLHDAAVIGEKRVSSDPKNVESRITLAAAYKRSGNSVGRYWQLHTANLLKPNDPRITQLLKEAAAAMRKDQSAAGNIEFRPGGQNTPGPPPPADLIPMNEVGAPITP